MFVPLYYATFFQKSLAFNLVDSGAACRHIWRLWQWCSDCDPCTSSTWVTERWLEMQILTSPAPSLPPPSRHRITIHICGAQLSVYSEVLQEMLLQALLWETVIQGTYFHFHKRYVCIHMNLKLATINFTENFCNLLLLKIF